MTSITPRSLLLALIPALLINAPISAQQPAEPIFDQLLQAFRTRALRIGAFVQVVGDYQAERDATEGTNGFTFPRARVSVRGELDRGFAYSVELDLARSPVLSDVWLRYTASPAFAIDMGQFKTPFSGERLQSTPTLDFVNRSQIVRALAPGRQIGVQVRGRLQSIGMGYMFGAFNGNAPSSLTNDNNELMLAGRWSIGFTPADAGTQGIEVAVNGVRSRDEAVTLGYALGDTFRGVRTLLGADLRAERGALRLSAEYIHGKLEDAEAQTTSRPFGYHATASLRVAPKHRVNFRWDSMHGDGRRSDRDLAIFGWSYQVTTPVKFMVNYVYPSGEPFERHQFLTVLQLYF